MTRVLGAVLISLVVFGVAVLGLVLTGGAGGVEVLLAASVAALIGFPFAMPDTRPPQDE